MALFHRLALVLLALVIGAQGLSRSGRQFCNLKCARSGPARKTALASTHGTPNSYQQMLQRAKMGAVGGSPPAPVRQPPRVVEQPPLAPVEAPIPSLKRGNPGDLPFNDEMYDELKYAIEKLTGRMKTDVPLTWDEVRRFKVAVDKIILDANIPNVAFSKPQAQAQSTRGPAPIVSSFDDDDAEEVGAGNQIQQGSLTQKKEADEEKVPSWLGDLAGKKSSWNVDGMATMDTEQYYREINNRISNMKNLRRQAGEYDPEVASHYMDKLGGR